MKWRMFALANVEKSGAKPNASKFTTVVGWSVLKKRFFSKRTELLMVLYLPLYSAEPL
jgi:hypothetical protein